MKTVLVCWDYGISTTVLAKSEFRPLTNIMYEGKNQMD